MKTSFGTFALLGWFGILTTNVLACSRVTYHAQVNDRIAIGRSMDFVASTNSSIVTFPAGLNRTGCSDANPLRWTSKFGSIVTTMYDAISIDGMNSEGLTGSVLYLGQSDYGNRNTSIPGVAIGFWLQYFLDTYATVNDAAADLKKNPNLFQVITKPLVPGVSSTGHVSLTDKSGDNLVMEFLDGKLVVHHGKEYQVMTNDPAFDDQLALNAYWEPIANLSLPGTSTPADRFVRLSHYNRLSPASPDLTSAIATTSAMIRAVSVPFVPASEINTGIDVWPTLWRVYYDTKDMVFFYESSVEPIFFWIDFKDFNLNKNGTTQRLALANVDWEDRVGNMTPKQFSDSKPFVPVGWA